MNDIPLGALFFTLATLVLLSGFFSGSETALMTLNRYRLRHMANNGHRGARFAAGLLEKPERLLGLILLGNNFINISAASIAALTGVRIASEAGIAAQAGLAAANVILTFVILVFAEVAPKTLAARNPEPLAFFAAYLYTPLLHPYCPLMWAVWVVNVLANGLLRLLYLSPKKADDHHLSADELRTVVDQAGGLIPGEHQAMLLNILDLEKITVNDIMVPRNEIIGIDLDDSWKEISQQITGSPHGRLPVYNDNIDNVVGIVYLRKFIDLRRRKEVTLEHLKSQVQPAYFIPENTPLTVQLLNFQKDAKRIGLVVDEYGDILGLVTVEDILEEIVGEFTPNPTDDQEITFEDDGSMIVDGGTSVRHLIRHVDWTLPPDGPKTLNGLILEYLENIPETGTTFLIDNHPVEILEIIDNVVQSARIFPALEEVPEKTAMGWQLMAKEKRAYQCTACGAFSPKWSGQCADCGAWNTLEECAQPSIKADNNARRGGYAGDQQITALADVKLTELGRTTTGIGELDRVLGGGLVTGSVTLLGGDPGIGKSTLLLQSIAKLAQSMDTLYVSGEESMQQITLRAHRLGVQDGQLKLLTETCVEAIIELALRDKPAVIVIDSIQTMYTDTLQSAPGAVAQLREATARLVRFAKQTGTAMFIVGHVTKEGALAGPRVLEHMVDTVLYFEGDPGSRYRVIRAVKNRFGAVNELGVFAMAENGLQGVSNPSAIFLSRHETPVSGSVIMVTREGTRPLLVETQALVDTAHQHNARRVTLGLEQNRLAMLLAVLHRHAGIAMFDQDVFVNVVGGVRIAETAADLPVLIAALSSFRDRPVPNQLVTFGEVGLAGEIRPVPNGEERLREAAKHGFTQAIVPKANAPRSTIEGMQVKSVERLSQVLDLL